MHGEFLRAAANNSRTLAMPAPRPGAQGHVLFRGLHEGRHLLQGGLGFKGAHNLIEAGFGLLGQLRLVAPEATALSNQVEHQEGRDGHRSDGQQALQDIAEAVEHAAAEAPLVNTDERELEPTLTAEGLEPGTQAG